MKKTDYCSFCGESVKDGAEIVVGPNNTTICMQCAARVLEMGNMIRQGQIPDGVEVRDVNHKPGNDYNHRKPNGGSSELFSRIPTPSEIVAKLDEYVVGQDETKKTLAVAVYNHYCRLAAKNGYDAEGNRIPKIKDDGVEIEKSNVLMIGPTGCGKTLLAKTIAKFLNVPFAIADATTLTEAGYVGEDVENIVRYAYNNAGRDIEKTKRAIIWVDELDKIASKTQNVSITRDVSGEGVQQALLKIVEGTICRFPPEGGRKHPDQKLIEIDTSDILFICGGAFVGLDEIIKSRKDEENGVRKIGFCGGVTSSNEAKEEVCQENDVTPEDLVKFGLIPEFVGRLPIISHMRELTEEELVSILTKPKNSLVKQYQKLLKMSNVSLEFEDKALRKLAKNAIERKTGARGLRAEMEKMMRDVMYSAPDTRAKRKKVFITEEQIKDATLKECA